jgi:hypothetical protein
MDLRTRYTALVTLMTQCVKFASETLRRAEEEEVRLLSLLRLNEPVCGDPYRIRASRINVDTGSVAHTMAFSTANSGELRVFLYFVLLSLL